jgi:cyclohexanecarboxylate-CoA ligase
MGMARRVTPTLLPKEVDEYRRTGAWSGTLLPSYGTELAATQADLVAVVDRRGRYTFGEIDAWATVVADFLVGLGIESGQAVTFQIPNWVEAVVVNQAILKIGAVSNPVIPIYREHELSFILGEAESRVLIVPGSFRDFDFVGMAKGLAAEISTLRHIVVVGESPATGVRALPGRPAGRGRAVAAAGAAAADDAVLLLYTSGTTADPKGAIHTHDTLIAENRSMIDWFGWTAEDVIFMPSPVTHITGYLYGLLLPFMLGTRVVLLDVWNPATALQIIREEGCTLTVAATPFLQDLIQVARERGLGPGSITFKTFACGGADVPPRLIYDAYEFGIGAGRVYGSTEHPTYSSFSAESTPEQRADSDGRPMSGEGRVVDESGPSARLAKWVSCFFAGRSGSSDTSTRS